MPDYGLKAIHPSTEANRPHVLAFQEARGTNGALVRVLNDVDGSPVFVLRNAGLANLVMPAPTGVDAELRVAGDAGVEFTLNGDIDGEGENIAVILFRNEGSTLWSVQKTNEGDFVVHTEGDWILESDRATGEARFGAAALVGNDETTVRIPVLRTAWGDAILSAGDNDNLAIGEFKNLRCTPNAAGSVITGIAGGVGGRILKLQNVGSGPDITLRHQDSSSLPSSQLITAEGSDTVLAESSTAAFVYDDITDRWREVLG